MRPSKITSQLLLSTAVLFVSESLSLSLCQAFRVNSATNYVSSSSVPITRCHNSPIRPRPSWSTMASSGSCTCRQMAIENESEKKTIKSRIKILDLEDAFIDDGENVVGTKFFGGIAAKEEFFVAEEEEMALELQNIKPKYETEYRRFEDAAAFDELGKRVGAALQVAINAILYSDDAISGVAAWEEDADLEWNTPFGKSKNALRPSPLMELQASKSFYKKLDVAILTARTVKSDVATIDVEIRWDIGAVWPNLYESRVLLTGKSLLTVRDEKQNNTIILVKQVDQLDGSDTRDIVGALSSQLLPRFWDMYHIGMSPSAELDPRFKHSPSSHLSFVSSKNIDGKKRLISNYNLSYLPARLVCESSLIDSNGREGRTAQVLPNHGFTTAIKTMGPNKESFVPVTPVEVSISKVKESNGSFIQWTVPVPPECASRLVLPLPVIDDDVDCDPDDSVSSIQTPDSPSILRKPTSPPPKPPQQLEFKYSLRSPRFVATFPYAGGPQDEEVTQLRKQLYQEVVERDGFIPKLDPETKRPLFFFWMNDTKACFTRVGGLGMAVYEWRANQSKSNAVGIELEL